MENFKFFIPGLSLEDIHSATKSSIFLAMSDIKRGNVRQVYSFLSLLSDFGGFNDGVTLIPAVIMGIYNSKVFDTAKTSVFPVKRKSREKSKNNLKKKL